MSVVGKSLIDDFIREAEASKYMPVLDTSKYPIDYVDSELIKRVEEEDSNNEDYLGTFNYLSKEMEKISNNKKLQCRPNIKLGRKYQPIKESNDARANYGIHQNEYAIYIMEHTDKKIPQSKLSLGHLWEDFLQSQYYYDNQADLSGWRHFIRAQINLFNEQEQK